MAEADPRDEERRHRRGLKFRKREDYAVELLREARERLDDRPRLDRILLELSRFYNPYVDKPIVDLATRRGIAERLAAGDREGAARLLDERLALYTSADEAGRGGDGDEGAQGADSS